MGSGIQQLINGEFVRLVPGFPAWIPWHAGWARLGGVALIAVGAATLVAKGRRPAATGLGTMFLLLFLLLHLPLALTNPLVGFMWTNPSKVLALWGGTILLAAALPGEKEPGLRWAEELRPLTPVLLGVFLLICGFQHFDYADFVDTLVPAWIPPGPRFWTYFAGVVLLTGGVGVLLPKTARLAATWSGIMVVLWVLLLHIPRAVQMKSAFELAGVFEAMAISGVAFLVAGTRPPAKE